MQGFNISLSDFTISECGISSCIYIALYNLDGVHGCLATRQQQAKPNARISEALVHNHNKSQPSNQHGFFRQIVTRKHSTSSGKQINENTCAFKTRSSVWRILLPYGIIMPLALHIIINFHSLVQWPLLFPFCFQTSMCKS